MAPFLDPKAEQLMTQYYIHNRHPNFLYPGSQETIVTELKAWVVQRKEVYKEHLELRDQAQKLTREMLNGEVRAEPPTSLNIALSRQARITALNNEINMDSARATYLLHTLKSRKLTWPDLWWRSDTDGGVCSFLGTVDETFDAHATLTVLEASEEEERLLVVQAELDRQFMDRGAAGGTGAGGRRLSTGGGQSSGSLGGGDGDGDGDGAGDGDGGGDGFGVGDGVGGKAALSGGKSDDGRGESGQRGVSRQEKRAEARKEVKGKAKDGKETKG